MTLGGDARESVRNGGSLGEDKMDVDGGGSEPQGGGESLDDEERGMHFILSIMSVADDYKPEATLRLAITHFSDFARGHDTQRLSAPAYVRGLPWKILAIPRENSRATVAGRTTRALGFFLQCNAESEQTSWSCSAQAILRIIAQRPGVENHERKISHTFYPKENDWGYSQFLTCEQLLDPESGFIKDDTVVLEVHVNADAPHGVQ
jgi:ubiquitin carboxyl-terminal hydrolase 7